MKTRPATETLGQCGDRLCIAEHMATKGAGNARRRGCGVKPPALHLTRATGKLRHPLTDLTENSMAPNGRVIKALLQIADMDRGYYRDHNLRFAQHPSETDGRLMVRLLAFALNASDDLRFAHDLSDEGEPELVEKQLNGDIRLWIEFGQGDEKWLRKACNRAARVRVYAYGGRSVPVWWQANRAALARHANLEVWEIPEAAVQAMAGLAGRTMRLRCTIGDDQLWLSDDTQSVLVEPVRLQ